MIIEGLVCKGLIINCLLALYLLCSIIKHIEKKEVFLLNIIFEEIIAQINF